MATEKEKIQAIPWSLASGVCSGIFSIWTFGGSLFVLFLAALELPKDQIGLLLSLFPFSGLIGLFLAPAVARIGRKRTFLFCHGIRHLVMVSLLLLPWMVTRYGHTVAMFILAGVIIVFALLRALAETALYPWMQEYIPNSVRGRVAAWTGLLGLGTAGIALVVAGRVMSMGTGLERYLFLIGAGSVIGVCGTVLMIKVPGGAPTLTPAGAPSHRSNMREALSDRNFRFYLGGTAGLMIGTTILISFLPLYIKEQLGVSSANVVRLDVAAMIGGMLSSLAFGKLSDRLGSRPVLMPPVALMSALPLAWLLLPRQMPHITGWCAVFGFFSGAVGYAVTIGTGRLLFNGVVPPSKSTAYTSIHYAWVGGVSGLAPLLAGSILSIASAWKTTLLGMVIDGYTIMFIVSMLFTLSGWILYWQVRPDGSYTTRMVLRNLIRRVAQR